MKAKAGDEWIDPATARRLLLEYRGKLGVQGASEIAQRIKRYTGSDPNGSRKDGFEINRKTIENLMNDRRGAPSGITLTVIARFMRTEHFQTLVPRARDYLEADARLCRVGSALFDMRGATELDVVGCARRNALLQGWWSGPLGQEDMGNHIGSYLRVQTMQGQSFSKVDLVLNGQHALEGCGIVFPLADPEEGQSFEVVIWSRPTSEEHSLIVFADMDEPRRHGLLMTYQVRDQPHRDHYMTFFPTDESLIPDTERAKFDMGP